MREFKGFVNNENFLPEPEQIFNRNEVGLFWKKMSKRNNIIKEERLLPGTNL